MLVEDESESGTGKPLANLAYLGGSTAPELCDELVRPSKDVQKMSDREKDVQEMRGDGVTGRRGSSFQASSCLHPRPSSARSPRLAHPALLFRF